MTHKSLAAKVIREQKVQEVLSDMADAIAILQPAYDAISDQHLHSSPHPFAHPICVGEIHALMEGVAKLQQLLASGEVSMATN